MLKSNRLFFIVFWLLLSLFLFGLHWPSNHFNSDNGLFLGGAWSLFNGQEIYRDFFSFTAPGSFYLILAIWRLFGVSYPLVLLISIFFLGLSAVLVFKLGNFLGRPVAYLAASLFVCSTIYWPIITAHNYALFFVLAAAYLFISGWLAEDRRRILLSALLSGFAIIFLQTIGLVLAGALFFWLLFFNFYNQKFRTTIILFWPLVSLPVASLFFKWSPSLLFERLVSFPFFQYSKALNNNYFLLACSFGCLLIVWYFLRREKIIVLNFLSYLQAALLLTVYSLPDYYHLSFVAAPFLIIISYLLFKFYQTINWRRSSGRKALFSFLVFMGSLFYLSNIYYLFLLKASYPQPQTDQLIPFLKEHCHSPYIYAGPFIPFIYWETRKLPASSFHWLITNHHTAAQFYLASEEIKKHAPDCAVLYYQGVEKYHYNQDNPVDNYLKQNYKTAASFYGAIVLFRN